MPKFGANVDFRQNQLLQARLENVTDPSAIRPGRVWFDPVAGRLMFGNAAGDAGIDPTDRAFHHGVQEAATIVDLEQTVNAYTLDSFAAPAADLSIGTHRLLDVSPGTAPTDGVNLGQVTTAIADSSAADRTYVDSAVAGVTQTFDDATLSDFGAPTADLSIGTHRLLDVSPGTTPTDGVNLGQVTTAIADSSTADRAYADGLSTADRAYVDTAVAGVADNSLSDFAAPTADLSIGTHRLLDVSPGTAPTDGVNLGQVTTAIADSSTADRAYVDTAVAGVADNSLSDFAEPTGDLSVGGFRLLEVAAGQDATDGVNRGQLDAAITAFEARTLDQVPAPVGNVDMAGFRVVNAGNSVGPADLVTRGELDAVRNSTDWKASVLVKSTGTNVALTGLQTLDGVALPDAARVLLSDQDDPAENGIWIVRAGAWERAPDADDGTLTPGGSVSIEQGYAAGTAWRITQTGAIDVGVTPLTWVQFGAATAYTASGGVNLNGTNFALDANVPRKYAATVGGATSIIVTHNLGTRDVAISVYFDNDGSEIECDILRNSANAITLFFSEAPPADALRCVVVG